MKQSIIILMVLFFAYSTNAVAWPQAASREDASSNVERAATVPPALVDRIQQITDAVLVHHIDPPARQQMILSGIRALYIAAGQLPPPALSRRVSAISTPEQLAVFLSDVWPKPGARPVASDDLARALEVGLLDDVSGGAELVSPKDRKVAEQIEGNRYVGIQVALGMNDQEHRPALQEVFEGGPADRAGAKKNDIVEQINGADTKGLTLMSVVDRLRGDEGTDVMVTLRQPNAAGTRTLKMTRAALPRTTVTGVQKRPAGGWDVRLNSTDPIGLLRITEITASTPHELRKLAQQLESEGVRAVVLDLRGLGGSSVHSAVLLADCLLDSGPIGRVWTPEREHTYQAEPDALFRGWPLAVLVDQATWGTAEWLAAALQDNHRAIVVGLPTASASRARGRVAPASGVMTPTFGPAGVRSTVPIGDGAWSITMTTGLLKRGDGRPLSPYLAMAGFGERVLAGQPSANDGIKTGVSPDHVVGRSSSGTRPFTPPGNPPKEVGVAVETDPVVPKAVQLLKQALQEASLKKA